MQTLDQVKRNVTWKDYSPGAKYLYFRINKFAEETDAMKEYLESKGYIRREDYEIEDASNYMIYVNSTFNEHNKPLFEREVKSVSIIPFAKVGEKYKIMLSEKMILDDEYKPITNNWGTNYSWEEAIKTRVKEEFDLDVIEIHPLNIDCEPVKFINPCLGKHVENRGITRKWSYYAVEIPFSSELYYCSIDDFINRLTRRTSHHELKGKLTQIIKN